MRRSMTNAILLLSACAVFVGCKTAELETANAKLNSCRADLKEQAAETTVKVGLLKAQEARICAELEKVVHERTETRFTIVEDQDMQVPCASDLYLRIHKNDSQGWVYLAYEKADQGVLYSDRLHYEGQKSNRNTLRFDRTYVTVNSCDRNVCDLQCFHLPAKHPTTSCDQ